MNGDIAGHSECVCIPVVLDCLAGATSTAEAEARGELDEVSSTGVGVALGESAPGLGPLAELGAREGCESLDGPSWGCI